MTGKSEQLCFVSNSVTVHYLFEQLGRATGD